MEGANVSVGVGIRLVGRLSVVRDGVALEDKQVGSRKARTLLAVLAAHHGRVVPREQVALYAWQSVFEASSRTMDVHVASLRAKLGRPELVQTIRGVGYRLGSD